MDAQLAESTQSSFEAADAFFIKARMDAEESRLRKRRALAASIQSNYGMTESEAEQVIDEWALQTGQAHR